MRNFIFLFLVCPFIAKAQDTLTLQECIDLLKNNKQNFYEQKFTNQTNFVNRKYHIYSVLPNLSASTGFNTSFGRRLDPFTNTFATSNVNSQSFGLNAGMTIFNGFSYFYKRSILNNTIQLSQLEFKKKENEQIQSLIESYINLCKLELRLIISDKKINNIQEIQNLQRILLKNGRISAVDTLKSYLSIKNEGVLKSKIYAENRLSQINLNYKMGLPLNSAHHFSFESISNCADKIIFFEYFESERIKLELINEIENLKIYKSSIMPSVSLNGNIGTGFSTNNKDFNSIGYPTKSYMSQINENLYESIGIYVNIPLFSKGEYFKKKELTDLKNEQLQEARNKNEIDYSKRIVEIEQKTLALSAEISLETDILITLQQVFDKTKQLYLEGRVSYLDLESISMTLFEKKLIIEMLKIDKQFFQLLSL